MGIEMEKYMRLKEKYGAQASWAIWDNAPEGEEHTKKNVDGMDWYKKDESKLVKRLNDKYILVGLNCSEQDSKAGTWQNFHSTDKKKCRDHVFRYAIMGRKVEGSYITGKVEGSYITDLFKGIRKTKSGNVIGKMKKDDVECRRQIANFKKEIDLVSEKPVLIAIGGGVEWFLKKYCREYTIVKIPHYAAWQIPLEKYCKKCKEVFESLEERQ